jgi:lipopolysaccharide/colanic/teichoic acid biosynthesis glycosyltransferase
VKRFFDVIVSAASLALLGPPMLVIAVAIRLDSPGPAVFRQIRVGRGGRPFQLLKFRSMRSPPATGDLLITVANDGRITRIGAFLRRSKLDELPQLFNVLRGEMSLVGPRPEVPKYVATYPKDLRELVLSVRPGITAEASLRFRDESVLLSNVTDPESEYMHQILPRKLELYARYVREQTLTGDIRIILRTLLVPLGQIRGARADRRFRKLRRLGRDAVSDPRNDRG